MAKLSYAQVSDLLKYDAETGKLFWKERTSDHFSHTTKPTSLVQTWNKQFAGKEAFTARDSLGYKMGRIFDRPYRAHRVAWLLAFGNWPKGIDHINGDHSDNRLMNLRLAGQAENNKNRALDRRSTSGACGVYRSRNKWTAQITVDRRTFHLGVFDRIEDAIAARQEANIKFGFSDRHGL